MKKKNLEVGATLASVSIFLLLIIAVKLFVPSVAGYGYALALLIFVLIVGITGIKLADISD